MNFKFLLAGFALWFLSTTFARAADSVSDASKTNASPIASPFDDLLQFLDGSSLHGRLRTVDTEKGVRWQHPDARQFIAFRPTNIAWIRLENAKPVAAAKPTCRFRFNNGDDVFGNLISLDEEKLELETWFGDKLKATRQAVQSITFLAKGFGFLYDGPTSLEGWKLGQGQNGWQYRDGAFIANGVGTLGRYFKLSGSSSLEFDLNWNGTFGLILYIYTDVIDRYDYNSSSYMFYIGPGYVTAQRVQTGLGPITLGQVQIPSMLKKNKVRLEIRANTEDATLSVLADGVLMQRWKDSAGFVAKGSGILFFSQMDGPSVTLSNLKVAEWDGRFETEGTTNAATRQDLVYLVNRDKVAGSLRAVRDGKLTFTTLQTTLDIPLQRVTQIVLTGTNTYTVARNQWETRAFFSGGGTVAFQLEKWDDNLVSGNSANFGRMAFSSQSIRHLQFNLGRSSMITSGKNLRGDDFWEVDE